MNEDCPNGIKNEKDIERLGERVAIMFKHLAIGDLIADGTRPKNSKSKDTGAGGTA